MEPAVLREDMVDGLIHESKGRLRSEPLADAMLSVPRDQFVEGDGAYEDRRHLVKGSTVLAPSVVCELFELLDPNPDDSVLIVGAGVGYTAAIASELTDPKLVHALDIDRRLVLTARSNLNAAGYREVLVDRRDGATGLPEYAPFDRILLEASVARPPRALVDQLADGGRLVMPAGGTPQELVAFEEGEFVASGMAVRFRPLLVDGEQATSLERNRMTREDRERARQSAQSRSGWEHDWIDW